MRWLTSGCSSLRNERRKRMVVIPGLWTANACPVDFARASGHCLAVVKCASLIAKWCKLIAALVVCAAVPCSAQVLPQLLAQIASFDRDHAVSVYATSDGVVLVLAHDNHGSPETDNGQSLAPSSSQPAHVVHIMSGPTTVKQSTSSMASNARSPVPYFSTVIVTEWRIFVPPLALAYSRPPPGEISISPLHRSTLLLI